MIYSPRVHIQEVAKGKGLIFHRGEVSELWRKTIIMVNNCHVFNLSNCSQYLKCYNSFGKINVTLLK